MLRKDPGQAAAHIGYIVNHDGEAENEETMIQLYCEPSSHIFETYWEALPSTMTSSSEFVVPIVYLSIFGKLVGWFATISSCR
jgi:hypothetical protein